MATSDTDRILDYWHSVEFFNAYDLDDQLEEARRSRHPTQLIDDERLVDGTWATFSQRPRTIYLLPFDVSHVTRVVEACIATAPDALVEQRDAEAAAEGLTCFAKLTVSHEGKPDFDGISLSALPWALGRLQHGDMTDLCADAFEASAQDLKQGLLDDLSDSEDGIFDPDMLLKTIDRLRKWSRFDVSTKGLAWLDVGNTPQAQNVSKKASPDEPEESDEAAANAAEIAAARDMPILNSFYVHDLTQAKRELKGKRLPRALASYLAGVDAAKTDLDSEEGQREIRETLRPRNGIAGRWPSEPQHVQSLMQQYALNKMKVMSEGEVLAVNGPPGTGKTTLLRDLIAHLVTARADVLASLNSAKDGLAGGTVDAVFSKQTRTIPLLIPALTGFEIVVASTNNGAVENLSLELPQCKGIDPARKDSLKYFTDVATKYAGTRSNKPWAEPSEPVWGLVSAALGKSANRSRFGEVFGYKSSRPGEKPGQSGRFLARHSVDTESGKSWARWTIGCMPRRNPANRRSRVRVRTISGPVVPMMPSRCALHVWTMLSLMYRRRGRLSSRCGPRHQPSI
ncbi:hypothetical protein EC912_11065 [Luteibacter rhizovicinus]|uniref:AAA domain-containing protein n=2 Tax=Luteibacter rhizovicinus TaxID=242606 RepID=A0A4R3YGB8_9GAMM|nr:hypothetical protein EC912_11065 [Luteibacter rhizovicinus]